MSAPLIPIVVLAALCGLMCQITPIAAVGQSVAARAAASDETRITDSEDGGQSRTIYSQKHLSPHRMMHFGKRPLVQAPPEVFTNQVLDLYRRPAQQFQPQRLLQLSQRPQAQAKIPSPYSVFFDPRDQVFELVQPAEHSELKRQLIESVEDLLEYSKDCEQYERERRKQAESNLPRPESPLVRFIKAEDDSIQLFDNYKAGLIKKQSLMAAANEAAAAEEQHQQQEQQQQTQGTQQANGGQQEQQDASGASNGQQDSDGINVAGRSVPMARGDAPFAGLTRAHVSSLLFGRRITEPQGSLLNLGNYIKKAEPQRMTFMHFGR